MKVRKTPLATAVALALVGAAGGATQEVETPMPDTRYRVVFTPVGWQVVDTREARDPVAEFGLGDGEYRRANERAAELNG